MPSMRTTWRVINGLCVVIVFETFTKHALVEKTFEPNDEEVQSMDYPVPSRHDLLHRLDTLRGSTATYLVSETP